MRTGTRNLSLARLFDVCVYKLGRNSEADNAKQMFATAGSAITRRNILLELIWKTSQTMRSLCVLSCFNLTLNQII